MGLGKKQLEQLSGFTVTAISFALSGIIGLTYLTDWKPVVTFIPYYNGKFKQGSKWGGCD